MKLMSCRKVILYSSIKGRG